MSVFVPYEFIPNLQYISNITQALKSVVTFVDNHNFTLGEWISFRVPPPNGMIQLNNEKALIISLTPNTVTINLNTLGFWPFISVSDPQTPCIAVPAGSGIPLGTAFVTLEDAFDNEPLL